MTPGRFSNALEGEPGGEAAPPAAGLRRGRFRLYLSLFTPAWRYAVSETRGREARLRPEFDYLYPDIEPATWQPVEVLINRVVTMLYGDRSRSGIITGERLLREDHFEFRGASPRPAGLPSELSRLSDAGTEPDRARRDIESRQPPKRQ